MTDQVTDRVTDQVTDLRDAKVRKQRQTRQTRERWERESTACSAPRPAPAPPAHRPIVSKTSVINNQKCDKNMLFSFFSSSFL